MSLIEKLKNLINDVEASEPTGTTGSSAVEEALEELLAEETQEKEEFPEYLECTSEETALYLEAMDSLKESKMFLADLILRFERTKSEISVRIKEREHGVIQVLAALRENYRVPPTGYVISMPSHESEGNIHFQKEE